jgi:spermidine synthase
LQGDELKEERWILLTAFLEGLSVLIIEIAGARAIAPYYGTSLRVWTSQITATLLFLALGYGLGGRLSRQAKASTLPGVFWTAGAALVLFPFWRVGILSLAASLPGIGFGSFVAGSLLFGPSLLALGAVSPLLIRRLQKGTEGGAAAGGIFFTNTLGGLAGGWLTALLLIPHIHLRVILAGTGVLLAVIGSLWAWGGPRLKAASLSLPLALLFLLMLAPRPARTLSLGGRQATILASQASSVGLIQVMDMDARGLSLLIDGVTQGGMDRSSGLTLYEFTEYQAYLSWRYHPSAKRALLLGLGTGLLAKQLTARGMQVEVAEIEPVMERMARKYFLLPDAVTVHDTDARAYLDQDGPKYDLIFMDAFAGENVPWYLVTKEGLARMQARLNPGGRLVINSVTRASVGSPGLQRIEAGLIEVFGEGQIFIDEAHDGMDLVNVCIVAGKDLKMNDGKGYPGLASTYVVGKTLDLAGKGRPAAHGLDANTDDFSDLDHAEAELRLEWRRLVLAQLGPDILGD